jgi:hypothetical protein
MRFMLIVKADRRSEAGLLPTEELIVAMGRFHAEMERAGVLLGAEGLQPSSKGARVRFSGGKATVTHGPFPEPRDLVGGIWVIQAGSKAEAIDWARRCRPFLDESAAGRDAEIEIRQVLELTDFPQGERLARIEEQVAGSAGGS